VHRELPGKLDLVWTRVEPILQRAVQRGRGHYTTRDIFALIQKGEQQLWTITEDGRIIAGLVSEVRFSPAGRGTLTVYCAAGKEVRRWLPRAIGVISSYAHQRGCSELRVVGRRGWQRYLKPYGFFQESIVLVKDEVFE